MKNPSPFYLAMMFPLVLVGCSAGDSPKKIPTVETEDTAPTGGDTLIYENAKNIFYSMPSPLELTTLVKTAGGDFRKELMHDPNRASSYQSSLKKALVLGVYGADMSYATVYRQKGDAVKFLAACKRIGESIGIHEAFAAGLIERANANLDNRDSMLSILTDMYWNTNSQLKEENRDQISLLVMAGGWAEGLFLGTSMIDPSNPDQEIAQRMAEQKYASEQLNHMFTAYQNDPVVVEAKPIFDPLFQFYAQLEVTEEETSISENAEGVTTVGGKRDIAFTPQHMTELTAMAKELRTKIIEP